MTVHSASPQNRVLVNESRKVFDAELAALQQQEAAAVSEAADYISGYMPSPVETIARGAEADVQHRARDLAELRSKIAAAQARLTALDDIETAFDTLVGA